MSYSVGMISLGCTKNRVDSEQVLGLLKAQGFTFEQDAKKADILIVNTCGFIESAKEESIDTIFELAEYKQTGHCKLLVVTGCLAQRYEKDLLKQIPEIDLLMGVNRYDALVEAINQALTGKRLSFCERNKTIWEQERVLTTPHYTCYHKIGDGCDNCCTYCAIPLIRGGYRSRDEKLVLQEIEAMAKNGVREHILVAQDTTRFGTDHGGPSQLHMLMKKAAAIQGVDWLRVLYCYPDDTNLQLLETMAATPNICKYLDLPIQHIDGDILKRMNRRGTPTQIINAFKAARDMGFALRTSIIVGFPGETEDDFKRLLGFLQEAELDRVGAFAFSPEEDTKAALMPGQIPEEIKQQRLDALMQAQSAISLNNNRRRVGSTCKVLVTGVRGNGVYTGRSEFEAPEIDGEILFTAKDALAPGMFASVRIEKAQTYDLKGVQA